MRTRLISAFVVAAALASPSASAQTPTERGGVQTETQERQAAGGVSSDLIWNLIGSLGVLGLLGLRRRSDNDGYTNDPI